MCVFQLSPELFAAGATSDPLTQNSCPAGWGNITDSGVTVQCAGIKGGGVSNGGTVAGTGRWKFSKLDREGANGPIKSVTFDMNENHWDPPTGSYPLELVVKA